MSYLNRAWLYITRKKVKTLIMLLVLILMSTAILSGLAVKASMRKSAEALERTIFAGVTLKNDIRYTSDQGRGLGTVTNEEIDKVLKSKHVKDHVKRMVATVDFKNGELKHLDDESQTKPEVMKATDVIGVNKSEIEGKFRSGSLKLVKGRHLRENDKNKVLIHEELAKKNNLKIGDKLKLTTNTKVVENEGKGEKTARPEIVGIFSGKNSRTPASHLELYENIIMSDLHTARTLNSYRSDGRNDVYNDASFFAKSGSSVQSIINDAKKENIDWQKYEMIKNGSYFAVANSTITGIYKLTNMILIASVIMMIILLTLILFMWMKERKKELAIFMSLGISKGKLLLQYVSELLIVFAVGAGVSILSTKAIVQNVGNHLLERAQDSSMADISDQMNVGADADSSVLTKTIDHLSVSIQGMDVLYLVLIGAAVIALAVLIASLPMLRAKPKQLLSEFE